MTSRVSSIAEDYNSKIEDTILDISSKVAFNILTPDEAAAEFVERISEILEGMK